MADVAAALIQTIPPLLTAVVSIVLGAALGGKITSRWELIKKRREADLAAAETFFAVHGEFYGIWQEWEAVRHWTFSDAERELHRWALFTRAAAGQAQVEALMTKLATERVLTGNDRTLLGCYRQAYRTLTKCLEANLSVGVAVQRQADGRISPTDYEVWNHSNASTYVTFKDLATAVGALLAQSGAVPSKEHAMESMREITANKYERPYWHKHARTVLDSPSRERHQK